MIDSFEKATDFVVFWSDGKKNRYGYGYDEIFLNINNKKKLGEEEELIPISYLLLCAKQGRSAQLELYSLDP